MAAFEDQDEAYNTMTTAHEDAESANSMIYIAGGIAGGLYLWNVLDALIFKGETASSNDQGSTGIPKFNFAALGDSQGNLVPGVRLGITFGSNEEAGQ